MNKPKSENLTNEDIMRMANGFRASRILLSAIEMGIFTILDDKQLSSSEVASKCDAAPRATDRFLNALVALGLLHKTDNQFFNTESSLQFLVKGKPGYMAGLDHTVGIWKSWHRMTDCVMKGTTTQKSQIWDRDREELNAFIGSMHYRASGDAHVLADSVNLDNVKSILDIGGGSGAYSYAIMRKSDQITATIFDVPPVTKLTHEYAEKEGFADRTSTVDGDYNKDNFPTGFDIAILSAVIHINSPEQNIDLIKRTADSLNPGGQIVIQDFVMDEDRTSPVGGAVFALNMLVATDCGDTYTENEIRSWLTDAGFTKIERKTTSPFASIIIGVKSK